jgi:hypothetical protein
MNLEGLSTSELRLLLMEETKRLTTAIRAGYSHEERDEMRMRIEKIQEILERRGKNPQTDQEDGD